MTIKNPPPILPPAKEDTGAVGAALERPTVTAAIVALMYLLLGAAYIVLSSFWAWSIAGDVDRLRQLEVLKGILFCLGSGAFIGVTVFYFLRKIRQRDREIAQQRNQSLRLERRAASSVSLASMAHDINNLLGMSRSLLGSLQEEKLMPEQAERIGQVQRLLVDVVDANRRIIESSRNHETMAIVSYDLAQEVTRAVSTASLHGAIRACELSSQLEPGLNVRGDIMQLHQAVFNLLINAVEAKADTKLLVKVTAAGSGFATLEVHDSGPGIPQGRRELVFKPFFTTKDSGTGLGLVAVQGFAHVQRGRAEVTDSDLGGACIRLVLPTEP